MGASERFLEHCSSGGFMVRLVDDMTVAGVANSLCQARDHIVVNALLVANHGDRCLCRIQSANQGCTKIFILRVADVAIISDQQ